MTNTETEIASAQTDDVVINPLATIGGGGNTGGAGGAGTAGTQGLIVITYTPSVTASLNMPMLGM